MPPNFRSQRIKPQSNRESAIIPIRKASPNSIANKKPMTPKDQQLELIAFSQNVHLLNQEIHKHLRQNKQGIRLEEIDRLPTDYRRPPGFVLVPGLLGTIPGGENALFNLNRRRKNSKEPIFDGSYFDYVQQLDPRR